MIYIDKVTCMIKNETLYSTIYSCHTLICKQLNPQDLTQKLVTEFVKRTKRLKGVKEPTD